MQQRANLIKAGKWTELDYEAKEFVSEVYSAFEQKLITEDQWSTTLSLYTFVKCYKDPTRKSFHYFEFDKGPYDPHTLTYVTDEKFAEFVKQADELKKTSPGESGYFCINFSKKREVAFLFDMLRDQLYFENPDLLIFLTNYIKQLDIDSLIKNSLLIGVQYLLRGDEDLRAEEEERFVQLILSREPELATWLEVTSANMSADLDRPKELRAIFKSIKSCLPEELERSDSLFFSAMASRGLHIPILVMSPDFNEKDKSTPIISLVLPTTALFKTFLLTMHGEEHVTYPHFMNRSITTREIRQLDENPAKFGLKTQARPVQIIGRETQDWYVEAHNFFMDLSTLLLHDFYHCLQNSQNIYKPFARYIRQVLEKTQGFDMTLGIWNSSDMDYTKYFPGSPMLVREEENLKNRLRFPNQQKTHLLIAILNEATMRSFFVSQRQRIRTEGLILLIDSIVNEKKWNEFFGPLEVKIEELGELFIRYQMDDPVTDLYSLKYTKAELVLLYKKNYQKLKELIKQYPGKSYASYILLFSLPDLFLKANIQILASLDLDAFLYWEKNHGLNLVPSVLLLTQNANNSVDRNDHSDLHNFCNMVSSYFNLRNPYPGKTPFSLFKIFKEMSNDELSNEYKTIFMEIRKSTLAPPLETASEIVKTAYKNALDELKEIGISDKDFEKYRASDGKLPEYQQQAFIKMKKEDYSGRSEIWRKNQCYIEAYIDSSIAIALNPNDIQARLVRAEMRFRCLDFDRAESDLAVCTKLATDLEDIKMIRWVAEVFNKKTKIVFCKPRVNKPDPKTHLNLFKPAEIQTDSTTDKKSEVTGQACIIS